MAKWDKKSFIADLKNNCNREVAKIGVSIIEFAERCSDDLTWGRGSDRGTLTFRTEADIGLIPLFHLTSDGRINLMINFLREKEIPRQVYHDMVLKYESNFMRFFDEDMYPSDIFEEIDGLFHTQTQLDKFLKTIEGIVYRLKQ